MSKPITVTIVTCALAALLCIPCSALAQISVSGDTDPPNASFWTSGGDSATNGRIGNTGTGELTIANPFDISVLELQNGTLAHDSGSQGEASLLGNARWDNSGSLTVGRAGIGILDVSNGAVVTNVGEAFIGQIDGSVGSANVSGINSQWNAGDTLVVGGTGTGTLNISNGGIVSNTGNAFLGRVANGLGTATVDGAGSQWNHGTSLIVGESGTGTLNVEAGGKVDVTEDGFLGYLPGSTGMATVTGAGSEWIMANGLNIGFEGLGTLDISDGGLVSNRAFQFSRNRVNLGYRDTASGSVTVTGTNSFWNNNDNNMDIGSSGSGVLTISDGGMVSNRGAVLAREMGSTGNATVTGAGSQWISTGGNLIVGRMGSATLDIENGGTVTSINGNIADQEGSMGTATVAGAGSQWTMTTQALQVGRGGTGTLTVQDGAVVDSPRQAYIGRNPSGIGIMTVSGPGSQWNTGSELTNGTALDIGTGGNGTLIIENGGTVTTSRTTSIARNALATGEATVTGAGSQWNNDTLLVGEKGTGTLNVEDGGRVAVTIDGFLGHSPGSNGMATVTGVGSEWSMQAGFVVGLNGTGALTVSDGGVVSNRTFLFGGNRANVGLSNGSTGSVTVTGAGSEWINIDVDLDLGDSGTGTLTVADAGLVSVNNGAGTVTLGRNNAGSGTLNIGEGSGAGIVDISEVITGSGAGTLNFNHSDTDYHFTTDGTTSGTPIAIIGSTVLNHTGTGTTTLAGANTHTGLTTITEGTLIADNFSGDVLTTGGTFSPGQSAATTALDGSYAQEAAGTLLLEIGGTMPGTDYDVLNLGADSDLNGTIEVALINGFTPSLGDQFTVITSTATITDNGVSFALPALPSNLGWRVMFDATSLVLEVVALNEPPVADDQADSTDEDTAVTITLTGSDLDDDPLTFSIASGPSDGSLGTITQVNDTSAEVVYTPDPDFNGSDSFTFIANDGTVDSEPATVDLTIAPVNDPPIFTNIGDIGINANEDGDLIWVDDISPGPDDESDQLVMFDVTSVQNPAIFDQLPAIDSTGRLTFTLNVQDLGTVSSEVTVEAFDDGGSDNGGVFTSDPATFVIEVFPVADLSIDKTSGASFVDPGGTITYTIVVRNNGPSEVLDAIVIDNPPPRLGDLNWECTEQGDALCGNLSGTGSINEPVSFLSNSSVTYSLTGTLQDLSNEPITNTASVTAPDGVTELEPGNNTDSDTDAVGLFADGFESAEPD